MKHMRKLTGAVLALLLAMVMTATAMASTIRVSESALLSGHVFRAYQIFTGTQGESEGALGDAAWGSGIDADAFLAALQAEESLGADFVGCGVDDPLSVVGVLGTYQDDSAKADTVAQLAYVHKTGEGIALTGTEVDLAEGYYLIVDTTEVDGKDEVKNAALLQLTDDLVIALKTDKPAVEKKVWENEAYTANDTSALLGVAYGEGYNDVADYHMGDSVPFSFYSVVPDMTHYETYRYVFHDKMSAGLTLDESSITVTVGGTVLAQGSDYTVVIGGDDGCTFEVVIADLKQVAAAATGAQIRVDFAATLNQNAVVGLDGNPNTVYLEYANNPDDSGDTGVTPEDTVIVFTYELDVTKVDAREPDTTLSGAQFKLHDDEGKWAVLNSEGKVTGWADAEDGGTALTTGADGLIRVIGLDQGTYYLKETKAPAGYNILTEEIEVVVTAATANGQNWAAEMGANKALTDLDVTAAGKAGTGSTADGIVGITVGNNSGTTLPQTGGMGTTVFYVAGTLLVASAAALLLARRRMKREE